jgi:exosortase A-associated hydrolase 2
VGDRGEFFPSGSRRLYGFLHEPRATETPLAIAPAAVVFVHPFMEERQDAHPFLRSLAAQVSARGLWAMRFDLHGCGDSEGEWEDATIASWLDDIRAACDFAKAQSGVERVILCGLRFGATLAALADIGDPRAPLVMIQPVVKGVAYSMDMLRAYLAAEMVLTKKAGVTRDALVERLRLGQTVNVFGYHLTAAQFDGMRAIDLSHSLASYPARSLVIDVVKTPTARASNELSALVAVMGPGATLTRAVEPQPLYAEGKVHLTRAEQVELALLGWLEALDQP